MSGTPPLDGIHVLELANLMAGPYCGLLLADLGADVIKVENPDGGDFSRATAPFVEGESAGFMALNRNKRSLSLNLKHEEGRAIFMRLAARADVIVENFRPGTMRDLGIDYPALKASNARLIYCSVSGYGQSGPYAHRPGLDLIMQGASGLMSVTGEPGRPPVKVGVPIADLTAALFAANAIQAALLARERLGHGQYVDISLFEAAVALEVWETSGYFATGRVPSPLGSAHRVSAPYQAFRTADGHITLGATTPRTWHATCAALGLEHLEHDPRFATNAQRKANEVALSALIEEVTRQRTSAEWYQRLDEAGVPCGVLNDVAQVMADPQLAARGFIQDLPHPRVGSVRATGSPMRLSATPVRLQRAGPLLGEHNELILSQLGYTPAEREALLASGAVGPSPAADDRAHREA
ncbi:MAG TPA: CoA transferase [Chloroflexota bacterium]|nr:CoA transferase [Chloroflexota bacterium]